MVILLVDDQATVLSSLKSGINWTALSIHTIYTAQNALEAKEIILSHNIDILLSDIEMPKENGLSLLRRCRQQGYTFECIFLTSHADFFYAQEAIQLGSFDYLLQPARYEDIERVIQKTILRIQEKKQNKSWLNLGKAAFSQRNSFIKSLLHDWLFGKQNNISTLLTSLNEMDVPIQEDSDVYLLILQIQSWHSFPLSSDEWSQTVEEIFNDFFSNYEHATISYYPDSSSMIVLIYNRQDQLINFDSYQSKLNMIYSRLIRQIPCSCSFYTIPATKFCQLPAIVPYIEREQQNNISQTSGIFISETQSTSQIITYCPSELLSRIEILLTGHQASKAEREALFYLQSLNFEGKLNYDTLLAFCKDYHHCAYNAARTLNLFTHSIPSFEPDNSDVKTIVITLDFVASYLKKITDFFNFSMSEIEASNSSLKTIEQYIEQNLDKPLLCSEIAKAVYLSPDYISRLFHKEKGMPLKEYITLTKMNAARNMIITTTLPISLIASKVGYDNFSHFSKVYKKVMGTTPSSERNSEE